MNNKIIVIGGSGLLGSCFKKVFKKKVLSLGRSKSNDFVIEDNIFNTLEKASNLEDLIVHTAWDINLQNWESNNYLKDYFIDFSKSIFTFSESRKIKYFLYQQTSLQW